MKEMRELRECRMQIMNPNRKFKLQKMKDSETVKEYSDRLLEIANKVRLLGYEFPNFRLVQKNSCNYS